MCVLVFDDRREQLAQILAVDVLHREEVLAARLRRCRRPARCSGDAGSRRRAPRRGTSDEALIFRVLGADPLEHDVALEAFDAVGATEQDVGHAARREMLQDGVPPQSLCAHFAAIVRNRDADRIKHRRATSDVLGCRAYMSESFGIVAARRADRRRWSRRSVARSPRRRRSPRSSDCTRTSRATTKALRQFAVEQQLTTTLPRHPNVVHALRSWRCRPAVPTSRSSSSPAKTYAGSSPRPRRTGRGSAQVVIPRARALADRHGRVRCRRAPTRERLGPRRHLSGQPGRRSRRRDRTASS